MKFAIEVEEIKQLYLHLQDQQHVADMAMRRWQRWLSATPSSLFASPFGAWVGLLAHLS